MTVTASRLGELVRLRLNFIRQFAATNTAAFTFRPTAGQTVAPWSTAGAKGFSFHLMGLFMRMVKTCGPQFEAGLADRKILAEAAVRKQTLPSSPPL